MQSDPIVESILKERYYQPGESTWEDIARRVANYIGDDDKTKNQYYLAISEKELIPNSPCLMNAGTETGGSLSACFSVDVEDSIDSIFDAVKSCAIIHKHGGGTGITLSNIRSNGSIVAGTGHVASGPVSFLNVFNQATETIKQGGKRRGANLGHLNIDHPDIVEFIKCKEREGNLNNFNISVNITDAFMQRVSSNDHDAKWTENATVGEIWNLIVHGNWLNGEPGVIFSDAAERDNACKHLGCLSNTNPCAETRLFPWESCNLASINLMSCCLNNDFNWNKFEQLIRLGVRFLDDMIDKNHYPLYVIDKATKLTRKIGLGVMGFADLLILLNMRYGDKESLDFTDRLFLFMRNTADEESVNIANVKGTYPGSIEDNRRNAAVLSIAPTGSISLFAGVSSGIEPNFGWVYKRSTWVDGDKKTYNMVHPLFEEYILNKYINRRNSIEDYATWKGSIHGCSYINEPLRNIFVTAKDISPLNHVRMQAAIQKHVDQAISKTCNVPNETTEEEISELIKFAWESGCKGLTIYREGSRNDVVLETNASKKEDIIDIKNPVEYKLVTGNGRILPKTPKESPATLFKRTSGCGHMMISVGEMDNQPHSVTIVNKGGCDALTQALAEMTALALRWKVPQWDINKVLCGIKCSAAMKNPKSDGKSCANILGSILRDFYPHEEEPPKEDNAIKNNTSVIESKMESCPKCGEGLIHESGCVSCNSCGYSRCS